MTQQQLINEGLQDGKKSFEFLAKEIGKNFGWDRVHKAMIALNWCWSLGRDSFGNDNMGIPNIETIKNHAYRLLKQAYEEDKTISTGGFTAGWDSGELYLTFTLEEWSS